MSQEFTSTRIPLTIDGIAVDLAAIHRSGSRTPILFLHGFGSTKEDYADIVRQPDFEWQPFVAFDAPGCGETRCADLSKVSIAFQVQAALAVADHFGFERFHLVGHSMGGLSALLLAHAHPDRVVSFVNIKGNLAPEDCFLSRQIFDYPQGDIERFFDAFIERVRSAPTYSSALYAASLRHKVQVGAVGGIFRSMVDLSDNGDLLQKFISLPIPKMFMFGDQYSSLSYLPYIQEHGVTLAEVLYCGHFPMYVNPRQMWQYIATLHDRCTLDQSRHIASSD
jgi:pimeloyl-ACP methyl ester carboxylesterase